MLKLPSPAVQVLEKAPVNLRLLEATKVTTRLACAQCCTFASSDRLMFPAHVSCMQMGKAVCTLHGHQDAAVVVAAQRLTSAWRATAVAALQHAKRAMAMQKAQSDSQVEEKIC